MNSFDLGILTWVNQFSHRWYLFDASVYHLAYFNLLKGTPFVLVLTWLWVSKGEARQRNREVVVATAIAAMCTIVIGRLIANGLPFRLRPSSRTDINFIAPYVAEGAYRFWSAFPSDTAMVFSALATGLWFASRRLGIAAHAYAAIFIGLPRLYLGMHHPTDLLVGAALGVAVSALANNEAVRPRLAAWPLRFAEARPTAFSVAAMLMALQLATMFDDARAVVRGSHLMARAAWCRVVGRVGCTDPQPDEKRSIEKAAAEAARRLSRSEGR